MLSSWCCSADSWHVILPCLPSIKRLPPTLHSFPSTSHNVCRHGLLHVGCSPHWRAQPWCWRGGLGAPDNTGGNSNSSYHKRSREDSSKVCEFLPCLLQTASAPALLGMLAHCPRREVELTVWERLAALFFTVLVCTVLVWPSWCGTPRASLSKLMPISRPTMHHSSCCQPERMLADLEKVVLVEATACRSGCSLSLHFSNLVFLSTASSYLQRSSIPFAYTQTERHRCLCSATAFLPCKICLPCPFSPQAVFVSGWQATTRR
jgi:hypothetical protein